MTELGQDPPQHLAGLRDDNPSEIDLIGVDRLVDAIEATITHPDLDPVTVGVNAPWGGGKTTVLELLRSRLAKHEDIVVVFVSPWEYDATTDPRTALIEAVLDELDRYAKEKTGFEKFRGLLGQLHERVDVAKSVKLAAKSALTLTLPSLDQLMGVVRDKETLKVTERGDRADLQGFRDKFSQLLDPGDGDAAGAAGIRRVVVLVDDLDRALPDAVVESLEAIKLFLSVKKMAFVIAADEQNVADSIQRRLDRSGQPITGSLYLEKIVQIPFRVPAPTRQRTTEYLALLMLAHTADVSALRAVLDDTRDSGETLAARLADHVADTGLVALAEQLGPVLYHQTGGNPRRLKRFLNAFWVRSAQASASGVELAPDVYAKMMVAEMLYPDLFASLLGWLATDELEVRVVEIEQGDGDHAAHVGEWGRMPPTLEGSDLAGYLHLATSLRGDTLIDSGLPADLRDVAERLMSASDATHLGAVDDARELDVHEKTAVGRHLAALVRQIDDPGRQRNLCRGIAAVTDDDAAAATVATELRLADVTRLAPAVPVALAGTGDLNPAIRGLLVEWQDDPAAPNDLRQSAADIVENR